MPTLDDQIYGAAAEALAELNQPDLSAFKAEDVDMAMSRAFTFNGPQSGWLDWLKKRVAELSRNSVRLEDADPNEFPFRVKQPGVAYERLVGPKGTRLLLIGPFQPPFQIVK